MAHNFAYVFLWVYMLGALWLIVSGIASFFTKHCTLWVGSKVFQLTGSKAILGGAITILIEVLLLALAFYQWQGLVSQEYFQ